MPAEIIMGAGERRSSMQFQDIPVLNDMIPFNFLPGEFA